MLPVTPCEVGILFYGIQYMLGISDQWWFLPSSGLTSWRINDGEGHSTCHYHTWSPIYKIFPLLLAKVLFIASVILDSTDLEIWVLKKGLLPLGTWSLTWKLWILPWSFEAPHTTKRPCKSWIKCWLGWFIPILQRNRVYATSQEQGELWEKPRDPPHLLVLPCSVVKTSGRS